MKNTFTAVRENSFSTIRQNSFMYNIKKYKYLYLLLVPGVIWLIIFKYIPMYGVVLAFKDYQIFKGAFKSPWIGFENFYTLFTDKYFLPILYNTIIISFYKLIIGFPAPILIALMLNEVSNKYFKKAVQTSIYFPHFLSWVIVGGLISTLLSPQGLVNSFLEGIGIEAIYLSDPKYFRGILVVSDMWKDTGWGTVMYLSALSGIDAELYEAATIDGANRIKKLIYITIPSIVPIIVILLILRMGKIMEVGFEQVLLLLNTNVRDVGEILDTYVYKMGFENQKYSFSISVGLFKSVVNLIFVLTTNYISNKIGQEGLF